MQVESEVSLHYFQTKHIFGSERPRKLKLKSSHSFAYRLTLGRKPLKASFFMPSSIWYSNLSVHWAVANAKREAAVMSFMVGFHNFPQSNISFCFVAICFEMQTVRKLRKENESWIEFKNVLLVSKRSWLREGLRPTTSQKWRIFKPSRILRIEPRRGHESRSLRLSELRAGQIPFSSAAERST